MNPCAPRERLLGAAAVSLWLALCAGCPGSGSAPSVTALGYDTHTSFPIAAGAHEKADCNTCHGEFNTFKQFNCVACHEHDQAPTDASHSQVADYTWSGTSCYQCHPDGKASDVDHAAFFPITAETAHAGISCVTCHVDGKNRKVVDCIGCHTHSAPDTNAIHTGIVDYAYTSPKCLDCHPQSTVPGTNHAAFFPIQGSDTHAGNSCRSCHPDRANRKTLDCLTCHPASATAPQHTVVGGYTSTSSACVRCHADSQVSTVASHTPFSIRSGTKHYRTSCLTCHPVARTDKTWAQDFAPFDCLSCHAKGETDGHHRNRAGYQYKSTTCVNSGCHQNGRNP